MKTKAKLIKTWTNLYSQTETYKNLNKNIKRIVNGIIHIQEVVESSTNISKTNNLNQKEYKQGSSIIAMAILRWKIITSYRLKICHKYCADKKTKITYKYIEN